MATVEARDVGKVYDGRQVLARLDLAMADGELLCLLGPSGCGKTTLLRIVAGFIAPDSGRVMVGGRDVTALPARARRMGMVFQAYSLFPNMTALQNVRFGPRVRGLGDAKAQSNWSARAALLDHGSAVAAHVRQVPAPAFRWSAAARGAGARAWR